MTGLEFSSDGYEGVTVAGLAVIRRDGPVSVFLAQRTPDDTDDEAVRETWEFVGGHLSAGEEPFAAASREWGEEIGFALPEGEVLDGWRAGKGADGGDSEGHYQGFVYEAVAFPDIREWQPTSEVQAVGWFTPDEALALENLRPEVRESPAWDLIAALDVSGNEEGADMADEENAEGAEPEFGMSDLSLAPVKIHGVLAPENTPSGDGRGMNASALTRRAPLRLPFGWQKSMRSGHDGAVTVGSIDRMMRRDGLIHWEGELLSSAEADEFMDLLAHFGKYGTSIDGDQGVLDEGRSDSEGMAWFDALRIAGATACAVPAFQEAYVALGPHPDMPDEDSDDGSVLIAGARPEAYRAEVFKRGPGWVTNPVETKRLHDYWTKPGEPGFIKIGWGTPGDWTRCTVLVGEKIAANSPEKARFIKQICAEWHHDALGYWPGDLGKPGNPPDTPENRKRAARHAESASDTEAASAGNEEGAASDAPWEAVLVSSAGSNKGERVYPPASYFTRHEDSGALVIEEPDAQGIRRVHGYAGEWGVCHIGYGNKSDPVCVEVPVDPANGDYSEFHLGLTRLDDGSTISTGLITYNVEHRDADTILSESATQAHFDDLRSAWAAVRLGEDERGIWFSGVVLPKVDEDDLVRIQASGQVSGEWKYGVLRTLLTVGVPGFPVMRSSAVVDDAGNVLALVASAIGAGSGDCAPTPAERVAALRQAHEEAEREAETASRFNRLREAWKERI